MTKEREKQYISEAFTPKKAAITLRVEFEVATQGNSLVLERSITGKDWVPAQVVTGFGFDGSAVEFGVDGITPGQQLRLVAGAPGKAMYIE